MSEPSIEERYPNTPYKVGDMPPTGYVSWHEWAAIQCDGGLVQMRCKNCKKYFFPQEYEKHFTQECPEEEQ